MKIHKNARLQEVKDFYCQLIQHIIFHSMDDKGKFEAREIKCQVTKLWHDDFIENNLHLDERFRNEIILMFNRIMVDLDTSSYNRAAAIQTHGW